MRIIFILLLAMIVILGASAAFGESSIIEDEEEVIFEEEEAFFFEEEVDIDSLGSAAPFPEYEFELRLIIIPFLVIILVFWNVRWRNEILRIPLP